MGLPEHDEGGPWQDRPTASANAIVSHSVAVLTDVDAIAEHLSGKFVVQLQIEDDKYRTTVYQSVKAAENAVRRANRRGKRAHVTLCQLLPVGVVTGLGGAL
jgi:hypothetical protein